MKKLTFFLFVIISFSVFGQDRIIKKSGVIIEAKVSEIAADEVKYYYADNPKLIFGIDKVLIEKIEFSTGEIIEMGSNSFKIAEYYVNQHKRALKINFLSPLMGSTEIVYEQSLKPGKSWETALGIVGLALEKNDNNASGVYGKFAFKFIKDPDFYMQRMHYAHILKGAYLAPEFAMRYISYDSYIYGYDYYNSSASPERLEKFSMALLLKFGKQWIVDNSFLVDLYGGLGYGLGNDNNETLAYGFLVSSEVAFSFTAGIRIGWVFGNK
jgi:hypothetical protein